MTASRATLESASVATMHQVDDECHMIFDCSALDAIRAASSSLFADANNIGQDMHAFMGQSDQRGVFWFVCDCLRVVLHKPEHLGQSARALPYSLLIWAFQTQLIGI